MTTLQPATSSGEASIDTPILEVQRLRMYFHERTGFMGMRPTRTVRAVDDVTFTVERGMNFGVVGESGSGKTTLARLLLGLLEPTDGKVLFNGTDLAKMNRRERSEYRRSTHVVFQDPHSSLSPRMKVRDIIAEPMQIRREPAREIRERVTRVLSLVGLNENFADRYPHQFSGGQRQRIAIARAVAGDQKLIILDEPVSALDVSIRAQILNLLHELQERLGLTYVTIAHDLSVVYHSCDSVAVMYLGRIVELADTASLYRAPRHPYTVALLNSVPSLKDPGRLKREGLVQGEIPSASNLPSGCRFHPRCPLATEQCSNEDPEWREIEPKHWVACHFA